MTAITILEMETLVSRRDEILLKAVALAIPMFAMNCFKLPITLCIEIERLMANFWWGQKYGEHKIYWVGWEKLCSSKYQGGLGF